MFLHRRTLLAAVPVATAVALGACSSGRDAGDETVPLRIAWWGSDSRAAATQRALDLYAAEHPGVTLRGEPTSFTGYFDKLATQTAAKDAPDVVQMQYLYLAEYARRGALVALDEYDPAPLDLARYDAVIEKQGVIEGKRYALPSGANTQMVAVAPEVLAKAEIEVPAATWTWQDFETAAQAVVDSGAARYAANDFTTADWVFDFWLTQRGGTFYTEDGALGFTESDLAEFWSWGAGLRDRGWLPPMSLTVESEDLPLHPIAKGTGAFDFGYSAQLAGLTSASGRELTPLPFPSGAAPAQYIIGTGLAWVITSSSSNPQAAAELIAFLTGDAEAATAQGLERGAPLTAEGRAAVGEGAEGVTATTLEFTEAVLASPLAADSVFYNRPPIGASAVTALFTTGAQEIGFGRKTASEAAKVFRAGAEAEIARQG